MAKGFKKAEADASPVYSKLIGSADIQEAPEAEEVKELSPAQQAIEALRTQGKKGEKLDRINMAFTEDNFGYIKVMSKVKGMTMTQFVNVLIAEDRNRNGEAYETIKTFVNGL